MVSKTEVFYRASGLGWPQVQLGTRRFGGSEESWRAVVNGLLPGEVAAVMTVLDHAAKDHETQARIDSAITSMDAQRERRGTLDPDDPADAQTIAETRARLAEVNAAATRAEGPITRAQGDAILDALHDLAAAIRQRA